jgi:NADPH2:quinone reductase
MKALLCREWGPPESLRVEEVAPPTPGKGQVLIDVKAAGVNFPDVLMVQGKYQFKPPLPFAAGCELAGIVTHVGEGVTTLAPGDAALALVSHGAFAEEALAEADRAMKLPAGTDLAIAAAFMLTYGTSYHALKDRAALKPGETLLVLGAAGGVGLAAVELGKAMGARVIAAASTAEKLAVCREHGADETLDYSREDWRDALKALAPKGVDVVYDPVGGAYSEAALRSTAWGGRFLVVGFAAGDIPKIPLNLALLKGCSIVGVFWGEFTRRQPRDHAANVKQLFSWLGDGTLKPLVSSRYPLARGIEALQEVAQRRAKGKVVILPEA